MLYIDEDRAKGWSDEEIVRRWHKVYLGNAVSQLFEVGKALDKGQLLRLSQDIEQ